MQSNRSCATRLSEFDDSILVALSRLGSTRAFTELAARYSGAMFSVAVRIVGSPSDAEDIVQETLLVVHRSLPTLRNPERFGSWAYSITRHAALKRKSDRDRLRLVPIDEVEAEVSRASALLHHRMEERWFRNERAKELRRAVASLPDDHREAIELRYWCELTIREISSFTGLPESTVKWRIHSAKKNLRTILEDQEKENRDGS